ncbi:MAG: precorrin-4 C(11)-methyltransferase [Candidatus Nitrospinota bacterium M3_3B_026]
MKVYFIGAGPGDPELLTVKAARIIKSCRVAVYAGSLISDELLSLIPDEAERSDSAKMSLPEVVKIFKSARDRGLDVARLHSGDPCVYGAIGEQMRALDELGMEYEVIPGVSSFQAAAAALKKELTVPEVSQTVILTRAAGRTPVPPEQDLSALARARATMMIFLSAGMMDKVAAKLAESYGSEAPVSVVYKASWPDERIVTGTLSDIAGKVAEAGITRTAMIAVGPALGEWGGTASRLYDETFSHGYRKARGE